MIFRYFFLQLISILFLLSSCHPVRYAYLDIEDENNYRILTENISSFSELEKEITFVSGNSNEYSKAVKKNTLIKISLKEHYSFEKKDNTENIMTAVVKKDLHIPVTEFSDINNTANEIDISDGRYKTEHPDNIYLPLKGLSYNGLYPDHADYDLFINTILTADIPEKTAEKQKVLIKNWLHEIRIKNNSEQKISDKVKTEISNQITWIGAVGDIMPGRGVQDILIGKQNGKELIFSDTLPILKNFDMLVGNIEGSVTYNKASIEKAYNFKFRHRVLGKLKDAGFDYLSSVNNHCYDFEEQGFLDTLYNLKKYKIKTSGAGVNLDDALKPAVFEINNTSYRILAIADYPAEKDKFEGKKETEAKADKPGILWPAKSVYDAVKKMSLKDGVSIVSVHGGYEWQNQPAGNQKKLYRKLTELGADIVIGSHPHVLQPVESWKGSLIVYSLGNFIFPGMDETEYGEESMILSIGFYKGKPLYINYIPVNIDNKYLSVDYSGTILKRFSELNRTFAGNKR